MQSWWMSSCVYVANSVKSAFIPSTGFSGVIIICSSVLLVADIDVGLYWNSLVRVCVL